MTYYSYHDYYRTYEWTAFREADLVQAGDHNLGYGDSFTMPASSTVCLATVDNDRTLSGDTYCDDNANDGSGQHAWVDGEREGGQFYAESYHVLHGADGKTYYLIEIEIEGTHDDYFSFYGDVPPAGLNLTIVQTCNVNNDWVDYKCLDAGPKEPPVEYGSVSGTVWCDDCDGIQDHEITYEKGKDLWCDSVTFESVSCTTYNVCDYGSWKSTAAQVIDLVVGNDQGHNGNAYDNTIVELDKGGVWTRDFYLSEGGKFCLTFDTYKNFCVDDEGNTFKVKVNGEYVETVVVTEDGKVELQLDLGKGHNKIEFVSKSDVPSYGAGIDNTELIELKETSTFAEMRKEGVAVKLIDAVTGDVVATTTTDAQGTYRFDDVPVGDYKIMGVAPDGTEFTIQDAGADDSIDSDVDETGLSDTFTVVKDTTTDIDLGLCEKELGSLSGRYFCDENDNDVDDGEPGIAGVVVTLFGRDGAEMASTTTVADGSYSFGDLEAGTYSVEFTDPNGVLEGKTLVTPNVGDDDAIDSDAIGDTTVSSITDIEVLGGQDTPDNDAGAEKLPGSLSGRYFCDTNENNQDDGNGDEPAVAGVLVTLLDPTGAPAVDVNGNSVAPVYTDSNGNYSFANLAAGFYTVQFTDPDNALAGKELVIPNEGNDASDSDAIGDTTLSLIEGIEILAGLNTPDNDAGVFYPNEAPTVTDDAGEGCADELIFVDFSDNFSDSDSASVGITAIDGQSIADGETVIIDGVEVTLNSGVFSFDGETAYATLDIGEETIQTFVVTVEDSDGGSAAADIDVTFCGDANNVQSLWDSLPAGGTYQIAADNEELPIGPDAYDMLLTGTGDARFDGMVFEASYCLSLLDAVDAGETFATAPALSGAILDGNDGSVFGPGQTGFANGQAAVDNLDLINWLINQDFEGANANAVDGIFTGWEVQRAIWELTDAFSTDYLSDIDPNYGNDADVDYLLAQALANGEGFKAQPGDIATFIVDPDPATPANNQPFIVGFVMEDYDCLC